MATLGIVDEVVQDTHSLSQRNVLRGLHYQIRHTQGKLVCSVSGEIFAVSTLFPYTTLFRSPVNIQTACLIMEGAEFTENIINGVERPVKAAELFAFTLRVRAGNTDVLTDAEENVRQKLRAEGVM